MVECGCAAPVCRDGEKMTDPFHQNRGIFRYAAIQRCAGMITFRAVHVDLKNSNTDYFGAVVTVGSRWAIDFLTVCTRYEESVLKDFSLVTEPDAANRI